MLSEVSHIPNDKYWMISLIEISRNEKQNVVAEVLWQWKKAITAYWLQSQFEMMIKFYIV